MKLFEKLKKMKKLTKKAIKEATISREVESMNLGRCFNHTCQLATYKNYEVKYNNPTIYLNEGPNTYDTGRTADTKKEFIDAIYELENED